MNHETPGQLRQGAFAEASRGRPPLLRRRHSRLLTRRVGARRAPQVSCPCGCAAHTRTCEQAHMRLRTAQATMPSSPPLPSRFAPHRERERAAPLGPALRTSSSKPLALSLPRTTSARNPPSGWDGPVHTCVPQMCAPGRMSVLAWVSSARCECVACARASRAAPARRTYRGALAVHRALRAESWPRGRSSHHAAHRTVARLSLAAPSPRSTPRTGLAPRASASSSGYPRIRCRRRRRRPRRHCPCCSHCLYFCRHRRGCGRGSALFAHLTPSSAAHGVAQPARARVDVDPFGFHRARTRRVR